MTTYRLVDEYEPFDETPSRVGYWYNAHERAWVVQVLNADGYQIGDATYIVGKNYAAHYADREAIRLGVKAEQV